MNFPPAPLLMRASVSTVLFSLQFMMIGIDKEFDFIIAIVVENMSSTGEIDVDVILLIKNPLFPLHHRTFLSPLRPSGLLSFECGHRVPLHSFSLMWKELGYKPWLSSSYQYSLNLDVCVSHIQNTVLSSLPHLFFRWIRGPHPLHWGLFW